MVFKCYIFKCERLLIFSGLNNIVSEITFNLYNETFICNNQNVFLILKKNYHGKQLVLYL